MTAGMIISADLQAQVLYTDVDPDEIFSPYFDESFPVDFNDDGITDITIHENIWKDMYCDSSTYGIWCTGFTYQSVNAYAPGVDFINDLPGATVYGLFSATPLPAGTTISVDGNWNGSGFARLFDNGGDWTWYAEWDTDDEWLAIWWDYEIGQWQDIEEHRYLGVKFELDGNTHYGWIEMTADRGEKIFQSTWIFAYAYETTPGAPIITGFIPSCYAPEPLAPVAITGTTAKIKWNALDSVDHFELQYRPAGALTWTTKTVPGIKTFRKVAGLNCDTEYEWRIRSFCLDGEVSLYSAIQTFTTASCRLAEDDMELNIPVSVYSYGTAIHILLDEGEPADWKCMVYDVFGKLVLTHIPDGDDTTVNTTLPSGIYIVSMEYNGKAYATQVGIYQ